MYPPPNSKIPFGHHTNARHIAGRFAFIYFPEVILFRLTKVNKPSVSLYKPISCACAISAFSRLENAKVNKMGYSIETKQSISHSINKINLLD